MNHEYSVDFNLYSEDLQIIMVDLINDYEKRRSDRDGVMGEDGSFYDSGLEYIKEYTLGWSHGPLIVKFCWKDTPQGYDYWRDLYVKNIEFYQSINVIIPGIQPYNTVYIGEEMFNI